MASSDKQGAVESRPKSDQEIGQEGRRNWRGLSWLEALFIGLGLAALIIGSALQAYFDTKQDKLDRLARNSQAVGQWLQTTYLLSQSGGQTSIAMCDSKQTPSGNACIAELISKNNVLSSLKNPYFQDLDSASVFAVFQGADSPLLAGRPCSHLAEQFTIITSAGMYNGKPSLWRGTIILYFQEENSQSPKPPRTLVVGYCDGSGHYQPLPTDISF